MQKFKFNAKTIFAVLMATAVLSFSSCKQGGQKEESAEREEGAANKSEQVQILYPNWAEGIAFTHLAKAALEEKGYDVKITPLEPGPIYATLAKGDADLMLDAWLPHTHGDYWEEYGDQMNKIGESFSGGTTGLVVPQYVELNSITELNDNVDKFDGKIIGIGSGAGIHRNTEKAIEEYGLDYKQVTSSGPAMMASLKRSYGKEEPIIITGWKPHHMWADYDLKYLEDPKEVFPKDVCAIVSRTGFSDDFPVLQKFFSNFNLSETELYNLMDAIEKGDDELEAAKTWYQNHKVLVESWMPEELKAE
ncbi:MAG TPA: glycine betaine ABC transporter substrate-binding protein [Bacteroidales bacterium]|nr:glycine betaine ABC transporter substrate-binding protein [Bacteroidales bacterium]